jgi:hypothetical protein
MMVSSKSQKHTRNEVIQIRYNMEQYMIAVTEEDAEATNLEGKFGICRITHKDIDRLYNKITGFMN